MQKGKMWKKKKMWSEQKNPKIKSTGLNYALQLLCPSMFESKSCRADSRGVKWFSSMKFQAQVYIPPHRIKALYAPVASAERCVQNCLYHWWEREKKKCVDESNAVLHLSWKRWLVMEYRSQNVEKINAIKNWSK